MMGKTIQKIGSWAFIIGIIIAIIAGFFDLGTIVVSILILLGLIVGFLNITGKETTAFLISTIALVIVTSFGGAVLGQIDTIGGYLQRILNAIMIFVIPATIVVALKAIFALAHDE